MFKIIDKSSTGKTKKLLFECSKNNGIIVCAHPEKIAYKCEAYGIPLVESMSYHDFLTSDDWYTRKYYIDEIDNLLDELTPQIMGYTLTNDD